MAKKPTSQVILTTPTLSVMHRVAYWRNEREFHNLARKLCREAKLESYEGVRVVSSDYIYYAASDSVVYRYH